MRVAYLAVSVVELDVGRLPHAEQRPVHGAERQLDPAKPVKPSCLERSTDSNHLFLPNHPSTRLREWRSNFLRSGDVHSPLQPPKDHTFLLASADLWFNSHDWWRKILRQVEVFKYFAI